jgi:RNA 3'-terminal phosphate cyclase
VFVKEGAAQLGFSKADALKGAVRLVEGTLAPAAGALASSVQLAFEGGTLSLPEGVTVVHCVDYLENGELKSLPKGTYSAGDGSKIGSYLTGSGTLRVKTSDIKTGFRLIFR